jgi:hypothetical protein
MLRRVAAVMALSFVTAQAAFAGACQLDHASYREEKSGAEIQFRPKDTAVDNTLTTGLFELRLPGIKDAFAGDITWNAGSNARPDGAIARPCGTDEDAGGGACWLWTGNVFTLATQSAGLLENADMPAPKALLLSDFGRSLMTSEAFVKANPDRGAFDVFILAGCK